MKKIFTAVLSLVIIAMSVMSVAAAPDSFVPSIEFKGAPTIYGQLDSQGNTVGAIIYDENGHEVAGVPADAVIITPLGGASQAANAIKEALEYAKGQINDSNNLGDLSAEVSDYLSKNYPNININDLSISQIFDIRLDGKYAGYMKDGYKFKVKLDIGESFLFLLLSQNKNWSVCKDYQLNGNILTLTLSEPTQIALVKNTGLIPESPNDVPNQSPQTGDYTTVLFISLGVLFAVGALLLFVMLAKSKKAK